MSGRESTTTLQKLSSFLNEQVPSVVQPITQRGATIFRKSKSILCPPPRKAVPDQPPAPPPQDERPRRQAAACEVTTMQLVLPSDANKEGFLFAGPLLKWIDICACMAAERFSGVNCVTVSMDDVHFKSKVRVGESVKLVARVHQAWKTSMEVGVVATVERLGPQPAAPELCCNATTTFVSKERGTLPVLELVSNEEKEIAKGADARREMRFKVPKASAEDIPADANKTIATELVMPHHCQHMGTTFGGWILHWMESIGSIAASRHTGRPMICVSTDTVQFLAPSYAGNVLEFHAVVSACWDTSLEVGCWAYVEDLRSRQRQLACQMYSTYVVLEPPQDRAEKLPPLQPSPAALVRRKSRLQRKALQTPVQLSLPASDFGEAVAHSSVKEFLELAGDVKFSEEGVVASAHNWESLYDGQEQGIPLVVEGLEGFSITCIRFQCRLGAPAHEVDRMVNNFADRPTWDLLWERAEFLQTPPLKMTRAASLSKLSIDMVRILYKQGYDVTIARAQKETPQGARISVSRSILHPGAPPTEGSKRLEVLPSGWVIQPNPRGGCYAIFMVQLGARALGAMMSNIDVDSMVGGGGGRGRDSVAPVLGGPSVVYSTLAQSPLGVAIITFSQLIAKFSGTTSI